MYDFAVIKVRVKAEFSLEKWRPEGNMLRKKKIHNNEHQNFVFDRTLPGNEGELNNLLVSRRKRLTRMHYMKLSNN